MAVVAPIEAGNARAKRKAFMSDRPVTRSDPCLHCMMVELIDDFFAEIPQRLVGQAKSIAVKRMK
jgi:hypothetical protein